MAAKHTLTGASITNILYLIITSQLFLVGGGSAASSGCPAHSIKATICSSCSQLPSTLQPLVAECCTLPEALMLCEKCLRDDDHCQGELMELLKLYIRSGNVEIDDNNDLVVPPEGPFIRRYGRLYMNKRTKPTASTVMTEDGASLLPEFLKQYRAIQLEKRYSKLMSKKEAEQMVAAPPVDERKRSGRIFTSRYRNRFSSYLSPPVNKLEPSGKIYLSDLGK